MGEVTYKSASTLKWKWLWYISERLWTKSWYNFSKQPFLTIVLGDFNVKSNLWLKSEKHHTKAYYIECYYSHNILIRLLR